MFYHVYFFVFYLTLFFSSSRLHVFWFTGIILYYHSSVIWIYFYILLFNIFLCYINGLRNHFWVLWDDNFVETWSIPINPKGFMIKIWSFSDRKYHLNIQRFAHYHLYTSQQLYDWILEYLHIYLIFISFNCANPAYAPAKNYLNLLDFAIQNRFVVFA